MKRALLIAGGTVGGLGAVLAITPPQLTSSSSGLALGGGTALPASKTGGTQATTAAATTKATPAATKATPQKAAATKSANTTATKSANTTATKSAAPAASTQSASGTFKGDAVNIGYGIVQVQITVTNGVITDARALQNPTGRNDRWNGFSVPMLRQATIDGKTSGTACDTQTCASYTSFGWWKSLASAKSKAGLPA